MLKSTDTSADFNMRPVRTHPRDRYRRETFAGRIDASDEKGSRVLQGALGEAFPSQTVSE